MGLAAEERVMLLANTARAALLSLTVLSGGAAGQEALFGADNRQAIRAQALLADIGGLPVDAREGTRIGRLEDVRVSPDGAALLGIVAVRPLFGGGRVAVRVEALRQRQNRLAVGLARRQIRSLPRL